MQAITVYDLLGMFGDEDLLKMFGNKDMLKMFGLDVYQKC